MRQLIEKSIEVLDEETEFPYLNDIIEKLGYPIKKNLLKNIIFTCYMDITYGFRSREVAISEVVKMIYWVKEDKR